MSLLHPWRVPPIFIPYLVIIAYSIYRYILHNLTFFVITLSFFPLSSGLLWWILTLPINKKEIVCRYPERDKKRRGKNKIQKHLNHMHIVYQTWIVERQRMITFYRNCIDILHLDNLWLTKSKVMHRNITVWPRNGCKKQGKKQMNEMLILKLCIIVLKFKWETSTWKRKPGRYVNRQKDCI